MRLHFLYKIRNNFAFQNVVSDLEDWVASYPGNGDLLTKYYLALSLEQNRGGNRQKIYTTKNFKPERKKSENYLISNRL